jgi:hypothetical protein
VQHENAFEYFHIALRWYVGVVYSVDDRRHHHLAGASVDKSGSTEWSSDAQVLARNTHETRYILLGEFFDLAHGFACCTALAPLPAAAGTARFSQLVTLADLLLYQLADELRYSSL